MWKLEVRVYFVFLVCSVVSNVSAKSYGWFKTVINVVNIYSPNVGFKSRGPTPSQLAATIWQGQGSHKGLQAVI